MTLPLLLLAASAGHLLAERAAAPGDFTPPGWTVESEHHPDLDNDGAPDLVLILAAPDNESRRLLAARAGGGGYRNIGEAELPGYPLGEAEVTFTDRAVLVIKDLTGGTTAVEATLRYRYEPPGRMRFIGQDITLYSRTNQHDATHLSFNWLTGDRVEQTDRLTRNGDYKPLPAKRTRGAPKVYHMEDTADPNAFLSGERR